VDDGDEIDDGTDPLDPDTDDDGVNDGDERDVLELAEAVTSNAVAFGERLGVAVEGTVRIASNAEAEIVALANSGEFDLLVVGASNRPLTDRPFLGHRVHYILEHTEIPVAIVALPSRVGAPPQPENARVRDDGKDVGSAASVTPDTPIMQSRSGITTPE